MRKFLLLLVIIPLAVVSVWAQSGLIDVVYLKNGSIIRGVVVEQVMGQSVKIETRDKNIFVFKVDEVEKMTREPSDGTTIAPATTASSDGAMHEIGKPLGGGIVFHVDASTRTAWIAAPNDQASRYMWGVDGSTMARSNDDGRQNTDAIISFYGTTNRGARHTGAAVCINLSTSQFTDWYLPSLNELERLYNQRMTVGGFGYGIYQSSTEQGRLDFFGIDFRGGRRLINNFHKDNNDFNIRCIRRQQF